MAKNILTQATPNLAGRPNPEFVRPDFDAAVWQKGYWVQLERALRCPCNGVEASLPDCQNCYGTGYFYVNTVRTKALITGINQTNQYKNWSDTLLGTIAITVMDNNKANLSWFDRVTFETEYSYFSENLEIRQSNKGENFVFTTYKPVEVLAIYTFIDSGEKLNKTAAYRVSSDNPYCLILDEEPPMNGCLSVYYKHCPEYHVIDLPHEIRASWNADRTTSVQKKIQLPIQAIARRSHLIDVSKPMFNGTGLIRNDDV